MTGRILLNLQQNIIFDAGNVKLDISNFESGIYILRVSEGEKIHVKRFIK